MTDVAAETGTDDVVGPEDVKPTRETSMLERWVEKGEDAVKRIETLVQTLEKLRSASIRATFASDWVIHTSTDADGSIVSQRGYLQDIGADRAGKIWGIMVERPLSQREDFPDGSFTYTLLADAQSRVTGERVENVMGSRWSGDKFFTRGLGEGDRVDPSDVAKAAYANLHGRCVRALGGLGGVPLDALIQAGLDKSRMVFVGYGKGAKGGESTGASTGSTDIKVGFGNSKGSTPAELSEKDLAWYLKTYAENVADPGKSKFAKSNQRILDALKAEQERRQKGTEQAAAGGTKTRGERLQALHARMEKAVGEKRLVVPLFKTLTKAALGAEKGTMADLTDADLEKLEGLDDAAFSAGAEAVKAAAEEK